MELVVRGKTIGLTRAHLLFSSLDDSSFASGGGYSQSGGSWLWPSALLKSLEVSYECLEMGKEGLRSCRDMEAGSTA